MLTNEPYNVSVYFSDPQHRDAIVKTLEAVDASQVHTYQGRIDGVADSATIASLRDGGHLVIVATEDALHLVTRRDESGSQSKASSAFTEQWHRYDSEKASNKKSLESKFASCAKQLQDHATQFRQRRASGPNLLGGQLLGMAIGAKHEILPPEQPEQVYDIIVKRPVKPAYREELQKHGNICLYRPPSLYRMFLTSTALGEVLQLDFVSSHELYGMERTVTAALVNMLPDAKAADNMVADIVEEAADSDTEDEDADGPTLLGAVATSMPATVDAAAAPVEFDLLVHRDFDSAKVAAAIQTAGGKVVALHADTIRFELPKLDVGFIGALAELPEVRKLTPYQPPKLFANRARALTGIDQINTDSTGKIGNTYDGKGEVVAVFDSGIDQTHQDFNNRVKDAVSYQEGCSAVDVIGHGTHVCGILAGSGATSNGKIRGIAPGAELVVFGIVSANGRLTTPPDLGELLKLALEQSRDAKIINLSWGDKFHSEYDFGSLHVDRFIYNHEDILVVIAAGNSGAIDQGRYQFKSIGTPATAKNAISCGASGSDRPEISVKWCDPPFGIGKPPGDFGMCSSDKVGIISSRGPSDYDSVKPDVCACGIWILAPLAVPHSDALFQTWKLPNDKPQPPAGYAYLGGTSMAAPVVSGAAAVLREYLRVAEQKPDPTAALLKSILIASARRLTPFTPDEGDPFSALVGYPDFHQGFGRIDLSSVLPHPGAPPNRTIKFHDVRNGSAESLVAKSPEHSANASMRQYVFKVPAGATQPLRVVLCWTDVPGKFLHNNLQLYLEGPSGRSWVGNAEFAFHRDPFGADALANAAVPVGAQLGGLEFDKYNNVELLNVNMPSAGDYRVSVIAQYSDPDEKAQGYALCISGELIAGTYAQL